MTDKSPFDHRPDEALGQALRAALTAGREAAFVRRVMDRSSELFVLRARRGWTEVLAVWARPGLVAAALLLTVTAIWVGVASSGDGGNGTGLGDPIAAVNGQLAVPAVLASPVTPDVDFVLAVALEN